MGLAEVVAVLFILGMIAILLKLTLKGLSDFKNYIQNPNESKSIHTDARQTLNYISSAARSFLKNLFIGACALLLMVAFFYKNKPREQFSFNKVGLGISLAQFEALNLCDKFQEVNPGTNRYECVIKEGLLVTSNDHSLSFLLTFKNDKLTYLESGITAYEVEHIYNFIKKDIGEPTIFNLKTDRSIAAAKEDPVHIYWQNKDIRISIKNIGIGTLTMGKN